MGNPEMMFDTPTPRKGKLATNEAWQAARKLVLSWLVKGHDEHAEVAKGVDKAMERVVFAKPEDRRFKQRHGLASDGTDFAMGDIAGRYSGTER